MNIMIMFYFFLDKNYKPLVIKRICILILPLLVSCQTEKPAENTGDLYYYLSALDSVGQSFVNSGKILGLSVAIMQGTDTLYNNGFGYTDIERKNPVANDTRFLMASVSKLLGSTLVMKLVEEGKLSLDQNLFELLPDFPNPEQGQKIKLKHMLSHTSGLQEYAVEIDSAFVKNGVDPVKEDVYNFLKDKNLLFEPGSDYSYCNTGFYLMSLIIERVTGLPFQNELNRVINEPTGMELQLIAEAVDNPKMSPYVTLKDSTFIPKPHWTWIKGDGGLTATSIMLAHFPRLWANGKIISSQSFETMIRPVVLNNGVETGYGIGVRNGEFLGHKIIGHTGGNKSPYSIMVFFPERDLTFVCFINTDNTPLNIRKVFAGFASTVLNESAPDYRDKEELGVNLSVYEGTYRNFDKKMENIASVKLNETDNHLYYCMSNECFKMYHLGEHKFWIAEWPFDMVSFHLDEDDQPLALKEYYAGYYSVLRQKMKGKESD